MTEKALLTHRMNNQQIVNSRFDKPVDLVKWMGAIQAQDFFGSLWSIGMRLNRSLTESQVENAISERSIVRTWPMRGTLHFVHSTDVHWMLKYLTPRVFTRFESILKKEGIDLKIRTKAKKIWEKTLAGENLLTRDEMYAALEKSKISTSGTRGLHLLAVAAQERLICFGPRKGKQQTFTLLEEWIPSPSIPPKEEAMSILAARYIKSHGPVMIEDFAWWAGLTKSEASSAFESVRKKFEQKSLNGKTFWFDASAEVVKPKTSAFLLPTYDEYGIAYKNRDEILLAEEHRMLDGRFTSAIMMNGKMIGTWRRTIEKGTVTIETKPFQKFNAGQIKAISAEGKNFAKFIECKPAFV
jgi:hypothetical protein